MKKELPYFEIDGAYGGVQEWFGEIDERMQRGGCGAVTACDCILFFALYHQKNFAPSYFDFHTNKFSRENFLKFGLEMKPYLSPRKNGIDTLDAYIEGFEEFLNHHHAKISMTGFSGDENFLTACQKVRQQIDKRLPIPILTLLHENPIFDDYEWHWYLLAGYEEQDEKFFVKAVTYGNYRWLNFNELWNTGHHRKGGLILFGEIRDEY